MNNFCLFYLCCIVEKKQKYSNCLFIICLIISEYRNYYCKLSMNWTLRHQQSILSALLISNSQRNIGPRKNWQLRRHCQNVSKEHFISSLLHRYERERRRERREKGRERKGEREGGRETKEREYISDNK